MVHFVLNIIVTSEFYFPQDGSRAPHILGNLKCFQIVSALSANRQVPSVTKADLNVQGDKRNAGRKTEIILDD
jgi:hypothetical protein